MKKLETFIIIAWVLLTIFFAWLSLRDYARYGDYPMLRSNINQSR